MTIFVGRLRLQTSWFFFLFCLFLYLCSLYDGADSAAPDGAALLGLGYGSDAESQDSGASGQVQKPRAVKGGKASPAEPQEVRDAAGDNSSAAMQVKEQEEEQTDLQPSAAFVKGQR